MNLKGETSDDFRLNLVRTKGEGRVSRDQRAGDYSRYKESIPVYYESAVLTAI
jgi:hypothetical protein